MNKMTLPVNFVYTENGIEKTSVDENERMNEIDEMDRRLWNREKPCIHVLDNMICGKGVKSSGKCELPCSYYESGR